MSSFCGACSEFMFGRDFGDFAGLCEPGEYVKVLCEDCGIVLVDHTGRRVAICVSCGSPIDDDDLTGNDEWDEDLICDACQRRIGF